MLPHCSALGLQATLPRAQGIVCTGVPGTYLWAVAPGSAGGQGPGVSLRALPEHQGSSLPLAVAPKGIEHTLNAFAGDGKLSGAEAPCKDGPSTGTRTSSARFGFAGLVWLCLPIKKLFPSLPWRSCSPKPQGAKLGRESTRGSS